MPQDHNAQGQAPDEQEQNQPAQGQQGTSEGAPEGQQGSNEAEAGQSPSEVEGGSQEGSQGSADSELWSGIDEEHPVRKAVADLRSESAARRTENRRLQEANDELKQQLASATSNDDYQAAIAEYDGKVKEAQLEAARERAGRKHGLPDALVARLSGDTEDALDADAQALKDLLGPQETPAPPPVPQPPARGGLDPSQERTNPSEAASAIRKRRANGVQSI